MQENKIEKIWNFTYKTGNVITKKIETGNMDYKYSIKGFSDYTPANLLAYLYK